MAQLGTAWRKHCFLYCCIITVFTETQPINSLSKSITISTYHTDEIKSKKSSGKDKTKPVSVLDLKKSEFSIEHKHMDKLYD
jgi:hypothetical protein